MVVTVEIGNYAKTLPIAQVVDLESCSFEQKGQCLSFYFKK